MQALLYMTDEQVPAELLASIRNGGFEGGGSDGEGGGGEGNDDEDDEDDDGRALQKLRAANKVREANAEEADRAGRGLCPAGKKKILHQFVWPTEGPSQWKVISIPQWPRIGRAACSEG